MKIPPFFLTTFIHNPEAAPKPNQADEIKGDPNQFRNFANKDSSKPVAQAGAKKESLVAAAREGDLERVKSLIKEGQKIDQVPSPFLFSLLLSFSPFPLPFLALPYSLKRRMLQVKRH